ncbi:MAG: hypothetical protein ACTHKX_00520 [Pseudolysinimonas sp.]
MGYGERNSWAALAVSIVSIAVYATIVLTRLSTQPAAEVDWFWPMLWTIVGGIVGTTLVSILLGMASGRHPGDRPVEDVRDRDIAKIGTRVGQAFLVIGLLAGIGLCAVEADWFFVAQALYAGAALSALLDCITRVVLYRRGMP